MCGVVPSVATGDDGAEEFAEALLALSGEVQSSSPGDQISNSVSDAIVDDGRFYCPFPGCKRSFAELWRLKVHYRAPPNVRGSGKERGHGMRLDRCPKCEELLKVGGHHVRCSARQPALQPAKKPRRKGTAGRQAGVSGNHTRGYTEASSLAGTGQLYEPIEHEQQQHQQQADWRADNCWPQQQQQQQQALNCDSLPNGQAHACADQPDSIHLLRLQQLLARVDQHLGYDTADTVLHDSESSHRLSPDTVHGVAAQSQVEPQNSSQQPSHTSMAAPVSGSMELCNQPQQQGQFALQLPQQAADQHPSDSTLCQQQFSAQRFVFQGQSQLLQDSCSGPSPPLQAEQLEAAQPSIQSSTHTTEHQSLGAAETVLQRVFSAMNAAPPVPTEAAGVTSSAAGLAALIVEAHVLALLKSFADQECT